MCLRCKAPMSRYLIRDRKTGLMVCEQCGFAVSSLTVRGYQTGRYIWEINPAWPMFHSFEELYQKVTAGGEVNLPPCRIITNIPSLMLTRIFDELQPLPRQYSRLPDDSMPHQRWLH